MQKKTGNFDIWSEASKKYAIRKLKSLIEDWQRDRKSKSLPWDYGTLAKELNYSHRNTIGNWLNGSTQIPIKEICQYFNVEESFFEAQNLEELDIMNKEFHEQMQRNSEKIAEHSRVSQSFLWYLRSDQELQDMIIDNQPTDAVLNSFDPEVPDVMSPFQFINSKGEKVYLNEFTLPILGRTEPKVKEFIQFLLWKEYKKVKERIGDWEEDD